MPKTVKFENFKISINENTKVILRIFAKNMDKEKVTENSLRPVETMPRLGVMGKVLSTAESLIGGAYNYGSIILPANEIVIDDELYSLFDDYQTYLNDVLMKKMEKTAHEAGEEETNSRYIVVYKLLLRTVATALKSNLADVDHGLKIMNFIESFIRELNESQILLIDKKELSAFEIEFASSTHKNWMVVFREAIEVFKIIQLPKTAMSQASNFLENLKHIIAAHILVCADYPFRDGEISRQFIRNTFNAFEEKLGIQIQKLHWDKIEIEPSQATIINSVCNNKIKDLYALFIKTNLLLSCTEKFNTILAGANWVIILSDFVNIRNFISIIRKHSQECNSCLLTEKNELTKHRKDIRYQQLIKYDLSGACFSVNYTCDTLNLLLLPAVTQKFLDKMQTSISDLYLIDQKIYSIFEMRIINAEAAKHVFPESKNYNTPHTSTFSLSGSVANLDKFTVAKTDKSTLNSMCSPDFNSILPHQNIQNSAAILFISQGAMYFDNWYNPDICHYLLQMTKNTAKYIRVIFPAPNASSTLLAEKSSELTGRLDASEKRLRKSSPETLDPKGLEATTGITNANYDNNMTTFKMQLQKLVILTRKMNKPALFISKEPGTKNHFICGLLKKNQMLFIDPLGIYDSFYQILAELKKDKIISELEIWLSSNPLQSKGYEEPNLFSSGPITLELAIHILTNSMGEVWEAHLKTHAPKKHDASGFIYHEVNINFLLPDTLKKLINVVDKKTYQENITAIRKEHYTQLKTLPIALAENSNISVEDYLAACKEKAPAQMVFNALIKGEENIIHIDGYQSLRQELQLQSQEAIPDQIYAQTTLKSHFFEEPPENLSLKRSSSRYHFLEDLKKKVDNWKSEESSAYSKSFPPGIKKLREILANLYRITGSDIEKTLKDVVELLRNEVESNKKNNLYFYVIYYEKALDDFPELVEQKMKEQTHGM